MMTHNSTSLPVTVPQLCLRSRAKPRCFLVRTPSPGFLHLLQLSSCLFLRVLRQYPEEDLASPPFCHQPRQVPKAGDRTGGPTALGQISLPASREALGPLLLRGPQGREGPRKRSQQLQGSPAAFLLNAVHSCRSAFVLPAWQEPSQTQPSIPKKPITTGESLGGPRGHPA